MLPPGALALFSFPVPDIGWKRLIREKEGPARISRDNTCLIISACVFSELTAGGKSANAEFRMFHDQNKPKLLIPFTDETTEPKKPE